MGGGFTLIVIEALVFASATEVAVTVACSDVVILPVGET